MATTSRPWTVLRPLTIVLIGAVGPIGCASSGFRGGAAGVEQAILEELRLDGIPAPDAAGDHPAEPPRRTLPEAGPITLADLLAAAEAHQPALAAARSEVGMSAGRLWQASLYPNPRIELSAEEVPFESGFDQAITTASVTQPIVLGGRRRAAVHAAEAERAASLARVELLARETFGAIAQLHARLLANRQADALYARLAALGGRTLDMARTRFEARAAPETEVIRPQIELYRIDLARARLATERLAAIEQLSLLLGGVAVDPERLSGEVSEHPAPVDLDALAALVRLEHPALVAADREVDAAAARLDRVRAERVPDLDVRAGAGYKGDADEGIFELGLGMTLPLWDSRQGDVLTARFALMRARQQRAAAQNELLGRLSEAHGDYESARAQLATVRDRIVPAALRSYEQTQEAYRAGHAVFLDLLDAQRTLTEAQATLVELGGAAAVARARLMQIAGRLHVPLDMPPASGAGAPGAHADVLEPRHSPSTGGGTP